MIALYPGMPPIGLLPSRQRETGTNGKGDMKKGVFLEADELEWESLQALLRDNGYLVTETNDNDRRLDKTSQRVARHFDGIYHHGPLGVFCSTLDGKLLSINAAGARMFKYDSPEAMIEAVNRKGIAETLYRDNHNRQEILAGILGSDAWHVYEERFRCKDGDFIDCNFHIHAVRDSDERPIELEGFIEDISERKKADRALYLAQFSVEKTVDQAFWMTPDGRFFYVNEAACKSLGFSREELQKMAIWDIDPFVSPEKAGDYWQQVKENGAIRFESFHRTRNGQIYPVEIRGNYVNFNGKEYSCAFATDITERKQTEGVITARMRLLQIASAHSLDELLEATLSEAEKLTESLIGFYHFLEEDQKTLALQNWSTRTKKDFCQAPEKGMHYSVSRAGVWVDCIHQRRPVIHDNYASLPHRKGWPPGHAPVIRELVVPVFRGEKIVALLGVGNKPQSYTPQDVEAVSLLADLAWSLVENKRAEKALLESEKKYRSIVEHAPFGITRSTREGKLVSVNPALASILKYDSAKDLLDTINRSSIQDVLFPAPSARAPLVENILADDAWYIFNNRLKCKDGSIVTCRVHSRRIVDETGRVSEFESFQENITDQLAAEQALRESEEKFRVLAETSPVAICIYQREHLIYANPAMEGLFGFSAGELCGMKFWDWAHEDFRELIRSRGLARLAGKNVPGHYEAKYLTKTGDERYVIVSAGVMDYRERPTGVASFLDITERKRTEELLRTSLAEKEVLLKEIHHRVKNNLQVVSSLLFLQSRKFDDPELRNCFLESQNRICSMALAHEQLYQSKSLADISIKCYVDNLCEQLKDAYRTPGQEIVCRSNVEDAKLDIEKVVPCGLLITELLSNAYKHAFVDGRTGHITISMNNIADRMELVVLDDGIGLPEDLDSRHAQTLGLQLVGALVNQLNGTLEVERNGGTLFRIRFSA